MNPAGSKLVLDVLTLLIGVGIGLPVGAIFGSKLAKRLFAKRRNAD